MTWISKAIQFVKEAYFELKKVTWLGKKEMIASTVVVILLVLIIAFYVGIIDLILMKLLGIFI
ncbi:MAG: preprotein translocase subunit SecE [bacterium]